MFKALVSKLILTWDLHWQLNLFFLLSLCIGQTMCCLRQRCGISSLPGEQHQQIFWRGCRKSPLHTPFCACLMTSVALSTICCPKLLWSMNYTIQSTSTSASLYQAMPLERIFLHCIRLQTLTRQSNIRQIQLGDGRLVFLSCTPTSTLWSTSIIYQPSMRQRWQH